MKPTDTEIDPWACPLCGNSNDCGNNDCGNAAGSNDNNACWCRDPAIKFPETLLSQVPIPARKKACICRACVLAFQATEVKSSGY
ncbi:cysteine-rich CWC family protein [Oceanospirillum maris]|uniref:cysteine-rich CWC family protein n=1 Tax=Oceanospirillum maris TaxID=64977 RepID=UPI000415D564|nr:cysteine-rich CWC family protein [Oceanospirillum maris]